MEYHLWSCPWEQMEVMVFERLSFAWTCLADFVYNTSEGRRDDLTWSQWRHVQYTSIIPPAEFKSFLIRLLLNISTLQVRHIGGFW